MSGRPRGRPKKDQADQYAERIQVRLRLDEWNKLEDYRSKWGWKSMAELVRFLVIRGIK